MNSSSAKTSSNKYAELHKLVRPHIDSFNYFLTEGLQQAVADLDPIEVLSPDGRSLLTCTCASVFVQWATSLQSSFKKVFIISPLTFHPPLFTHLSIEFKNCSDLLSSFENS